MSSENLQNGKRITTSPIGYKKNVVLSRNGSTATHKDTLKDNKLDFPLRSPKSSMKCKDHDELERSQKKSAAQNGRQKLPSYPRKFR